MDKCVFCELINGQTTTPFIYKDEKVVAFKDRHPKAPMHILVVPRQHIATLNDLNNEQFAIIGHLASLAVTIAKQFNHAQNGYRLVMNCNTDGDQTIFHVHMHLLAGRRLDRGMG